MSLDKEFIAKQKEAGFVIDEDGTLLKCEIKFGKIEIPEGVTSIKEEAFAEGYCLEGIKLPESLFKIGDRAFSYCYLIEEIIIPKGVSSIGKDPFSFIVDERYVDQDNCERLSIGILLKLDPDNQSFRMEEGCLIENRSDRLIHGAEISSIPIGVKKIGAYSFSNLANIEVMNIPEGVIRIEEGAFSYCKNLEKITLPDSLTYVGDMAFAFTKLKAIYPSIKTLKSQVKEPISSIHYEYDDDMPF